MRVSTLALGLLVVLLAVCPARAVDYSAPACTTYELNEVELAKDFMAMAVGPDDAFYGGGYDEKLYRSTDGGATLTAVKTFGKGGGFSGLFVDSSGSVFIGRPGTGTLFKGAMSGDTLATSEVHTFTCHSCPITVCARFWQMCEDDLGNLYLGEYTSGTVGTEECCYVYKSEDGGDSFSEVYHDDDNARHAHLVAWDGHTQRLYISQGDGEFEWEVNSSTDYGANWTTRAVSNNGQPISCAFLTTGRYVVDTGTFEPDYTGKNSGVRLFGSDKGTDNRITRSTDSYIAVATTWLPDATNGQVDELRLTVDQHDDAYVWVMTKTPAGLPLAGTVAASPGDTCAPALYLRTRNTGDYTDTPWDKLKDFGPLPQYSGVTAMTDFDSTGHAYYTLYREVADGGAVSYRFRINPVANAPRAIAARNRRRR